jgi:class 3 adenylate cyclase
LDEDQVRLVEYVRSLGATDDELAAAISLGPGALGPLALDLTLRPSGAPTTLDDLAARAGPKAEMVRRVWRAFGLPEATEFPFPVTADLADAIISLIGFADVVGEDLLIGFARVLGASVGRMAEALSDTARIGAEVPQRDSGVAYSDVVRGYTTLARGALPGLFDVLAALFRRHLVLVSYQRWNPDEAGTSVVLDRTVGFADLVGSTETLLPLSTDQIADMVNRFEQTTWDTVTRLGGRVVKLIGDEVMFVHADAVASCRIARELVAASSQPIRVGLARGEVVALHGDYYGPAVNLAARLTGAAPPSAIVVSESVLAAGGVGDDPEDLRAEPIDVGPLKGFVSPGRIFRLLASPLPGG